MAKINPIDLQKALKGVDYPADRQAILDAARSNGADSEITSALEGIPEESYDRPTDVTEAISFDGSSDDS